MTLLIPELLRTHGPVLLAREHPEHQRALRRAANTGALTAVLPGTYLPGGFEPTWEHRALSVSRWHPEAVVCGAAAAHWTFWPKLQVGDLRVALRTRVRRPGFAFTDRDIPPEFVLTTPQGIRLSAPELAAVDLIDAYGGQAIDEALRSRRVTLRKLWNALEATTGRVGNPERRRLLLDSRDKPWSEAEREAHRVLRAGGIRDWCTNLRVVVDGLNYFVDIAIRRLKLAIEIDSREYHDNPQAYEDDRIRQNDLVAAGWTVLRFTWKMLTEQPEAVIAKIRETMRLCARRAGITLAA